MSAADATLQRLLREVMPRRLHGLALQDAMSLRGELGIDSIGLISLAFRIEEEFGIDLMQHAERVARVVTLRDVRELVHDLGGQPP